MLEAELLSSLHSAALRRLAAGSGTAPSLLVTSVHEHSPEQCWKYFLFWKLLLIWEKKSNTQARSPCRVKTPARAGKERTDGRVLIALQSSASCFLQEISRGSSTQDLYASCMVLCCEMPWELMGPAGARHRAPSVSTRSPDQFSWVFSPALWALPPLMGEDFSVAGGKKSLLLVLSGEGELLASHRSALLRQWLTQALEFLITSPISPCLLSLPWGCSSPDPIGVGNFHPYIPDGPTLRAAFLEGIVADLPASHPPRGEFQSRSLALTSSLAL